MRRVLALMLSLIPLLASPRRGTPEKWFPKPLSPRIANYVISGSLDWEKKLFDGTETITWRNAGTAPTREFPLHLYLNAFKGPQSVFVKESGGKLRGDQMANPADSTSWGYCRLLSVKVDGKPVSGTQGEDETVYRVDLPRAVAPGEAIQVEISWQSRFPKVFARSGWDGNFLMAGQWFPKVGVYQGASWNCHAYHAFTEFYSDFGTYDVTLSIPNSLLVATTGTPVETKGPDGRMYEAVEDSKNPKIHIWRIHAEDVHDFAFAVRPKLDWDCHVWEYRDIEVKYYTQSKTSSNIYRQKRAVEAAIRLSQEWYFKYPYPTLTVIDTPEGADGADGMEYPTLITASSVAFDPFELRFEPEVVSVHEFGHQYFYGMLASNEFEEAWLDEGFNSWFTHKVMDTTYHGLLPSRRFHLPTEFGEWAGYFLNPSSDPLTVVSFKARDWESYGRVAYSKPTMVLNQLEAMLGRPLMEQVMRAYTEEMKFKHPNRGDFRRIAERVTGRDLSKFWQDFVEGTDVLDYGIHRVEVLQVQQGGWMEGKEGVVFAAPQQVAPGRTGRVTLVRKGGIIAPITLWVRLENREERRVTWDGKDRWAAFDFDSPVVAAVVDPDGNHPILKDRLHASWLPKPPSRGIHYWAQMAWGAFIGLLQSAGVA